VNSRQTRVVAVILVALGLVTAPFINRLTDVDQPMDVLGIALIVAAGAATALRDRWPVPTLAIVATSTSLYLLIGYPYGPIFFALAVAVYAVARRRPPAEAALWCAAAFGLLLLHLLTNPAALDGAVGLLPAFAWVAIPFTIGVARRLVAEANARERAEADRRLVDAERLRIAHEVHDVVGHGLAAIQMQADIALHVRDRRPDQAGLALDAISRASAEALAELRATLAEITPGDDADSRAPTPGLARFDDLRQRVEDAGLAVDATVTGQPRSLSPAVDLAAYRVLQEALTNVVKHSAYPRAVIEIAYRPREVQVSVSNQELAADSHVDGFGITGMRRRVERLGGQLTAGPGADAGVFEVRATIPTEV